MQIRKMWHSRTCIIWSHQVPARARRNQQTEALQDPLRGVFYGRHLGDYFTNMEMNFPKSRL
jgi:hypothetical protein